MAANNLQNSLINAIETLVDNGISKIDADYTFSATVIGLDDAAQGRYKLSYDGGFIYAYSFNGLSYIEGDSVYVLTPGGKNNVRKVIIGKVEDNKEYAGTKTSITNVLENYNVLGKENISTNATDPIILNPNRQRDYQVLYARQESDFFVEENILDVDDVNLSNNAPNAEGVMISGRFQTSLSTQHANSNTGKYGVIFNLLFKGATSDKEDRIVRYDITSDTMMGAPLQYYEGSYQYNIFNFDAKNFICIDSIIAFSEAFEEKDIEEEGEEEDNNVDFDKITIKDISFSLLDEIEAKNGDYILNVSTPQGNTFKESDDRDKKITIKAKMKCQKTDISDSVKFYWGKEDPSINKLSNYGFVNKLGSGWLYLETETTNEIEVKEQDLYAYENRYICCACYNEEIVLRQEVVIFSEKNKLDIKIESSSGESFPFETGSTQLTCSIDGQSSDFSKAYKFIWSKTDINDTTPFVFDLLLDEVQKNKDLELMQAVDNENGNTSFAGRTSGEILAFYKNQENELQYIKYGANNNDTNTNSILYTCRGISNVEATTFKCTVQRTDVSGEYHVIGSAVITLYNSAVPSTDGYYLKIVNGEQSFQYTMSGKSPASESLMEPIKIKPLTAKLYENGVEVNDDNIESIKWIVPTYQTMIKCPTLNTRINEVTDETEFFGQEFPLSITDTYNYASTNNKIECVVCYKGAYISQTTGFSFLKQGDNGTNGTDTVAKIVLNDEFDTSLPLTRVVQHDKENNGYNIEKNYWIGKSKELIENEKDNTPKQILQDKLFKNNEEVRGTSSRWKVLGYSNGNGLNYSVDNGKFNFNINTDSKRDKVDIISTQISSDNKVYETSMPFYTIDYINSDVDEEDLDGGKTEIEKSDLYNEWLLINVKKDVIELEKNESEENNWRQIMPNNFTEHIIINIENGEARSTPIDPEIYFEKDFELDYETMPLQIDGSNLLQYITYDSNGKNPQYNPAQGLNIVVPDDFPYAIDWYAKGGYDDNHPNFSLSVSQGNEIGSNRIINSSETSHLREIEIYMRQLNILLASIDDVQQKTAMVNAKNQIQNFFTGEGFGTITNRLSYVYEVLKDLPKGSNFESFKIIYNAILGEIQQELDRISEQNSEMKIIKEAMSGGVWGGIWHTKDIDGNGTQDVSTIDSLIIYDNNPQDANLLVDDESYDRIFNGNIYYVAKENNEVSIDDNSYKKVYATYEAKRLFEDLKIDKSEYILTSDYDLMQETILDMIIQDRRKQNADIKLEDNDFKLFDNIELDKDEKLDIVYAESTGEALLAKEEYYYETSGTTESGDHETITTDTNKLRKIYPVYKSLYDDNAIYLIDNFKKKEENFARNRTGKIIAQKTAACLLKKGKIKTIAKQMVYADAKKKKISYEDVKNVKLYSKKIPLWQKSGKYYLELTSGQSTHYINNGFSRVTTTNLEEDNILLLENTIVEENKKDKSTTEDNNGKKGFVVSSEEIDKNFLKRYVRVEKNSYAIAEAGVEPEKEYTIIYSKKEGKPLEINNYIYKAIKTKEDPIEKTISISQNEINKVIRERLKYHKEFYIDYYQKVFNNLYANVTMIVNLIGNRTELDMHNILYSQYAEILEDMYEKTVDGNAIKQWLEDEENRDGDSIQSIFDYAKNLYIKYQTLFQSIEPPMLDYTSKWANDFTRFFAGEKEEVQNQVYVIPKDEYTGIFNNNRVEAEVKYCDQVLAKITFPIVFRQNLYELANINGWDGSHINIDEENGSILAPQIGAGVKNSRTNAFTGLVMGAVTNPTESGYDDSKVGLLGYSEGKQSIFLDSKTGEATFGINDRDSNNPYGEGQIKLVPNGVSSIAGWRIGSKSFYKVVDGDMGDAYDDLSSEYNYEKSIPHDKQGILLSADPGYISIKGKSYSEKDADSLNKNSRNVSLKDGDSFELELNPNELSVFNLYQHTTQELETETVKINNVDNDKIEATFEFTGNEVDIINEIEKIEQKTYNAITENRTESDDNEKYSNVDYTDKEDSSESIIKIGDEDVVYIGKNYSFEDSDGIKYSEITVENENNKIYLRETKKESDIYERIDYFIYKSKFKRYNTSMTLEIKCGLSETPVIFNKSFTFYDFELDMIDMNIENIEYDGYKLACLASKETKLSEDINDNYSKVQLLRKQNDENDIENIVENTIMNFINSIFKEVEKNSNMEIVDMNYSLYLLYLEDDDYNDTSSITEEFDITIKNKEITSWRKKEA